MKLGEFKWGAPAPHLNSNVNNIIELFKKGSREKITEKRMKNKVFRA